MTDPAVLALLTEIIARLDAIQQELDSPGVEPDEILKTAEAARLLRIGEAHLRELAHQGRIPHERRGKSLRFSRTQLLNAFHSQAVANARSKP